MVMGTKKGSDVMDVEEVMQRTGLSLSSVYRALRRNEIPCVRVGGRWLIGRAAFERWLAGGDRGAA